MSGLPLKCRKEKAIDEWFGLVKLCPHVQVTFMCYPKANFYEETLANKVSYIRKANFLRST